MKFILAILSLLPLSAQLTFDSLKKDVHASAESSIVHCDFLFENKTDKDAVIDHYETHCPCLRVEINQGGKLNYAPGEKGVLRAIFDLETFSGEVDKKVTIWMKGDPADAPSVTLIVTMHIPVIVNLQPKTLEWQDGEELVTKSFKVTMNYEKPISITKVSVNNAAFQTNLKTIVEGKEYAIEVTPQRKDKEKVGMAAVTIETDCPISKQKRQIAFAIVRHELTPKP
jgi:hypothetical protein